MPSAPTRQIALRPMLPADASILAGLFVASIGELTGEDYSPPQQAAWIATADDEAAFAARLQGMLTLVATVAGEPVGFAALRLPDHIDMLYVHPESVGQGVGTALCDALEKIAHGRGAETLSVDASDTALRFFTKRGFEPLHRETVSLGDEWLGRTAMRKSLTSATETRH